MRQRDAPMINVTIVCHNDHESIDCLCYKLDTYTSWKGKTNQRRRRNSDSSGAIWAEKDLSGQVAIPDVTMDLIYQCLFRLDDMSLGRTET